MSQYLSQTIQFIRRGEVVTLSNVAPTRTLLEVLREDNIFGSKAVGEPPFMLAISVFESMKDAMAKARADSGTVQLTAPAENVLPALAGSV